jgi:hypothetical protein
MFRVKGWKSKIGKKMAGDNAGHGYVRTIF